MFFNISRPDVWVATFEDRAGALASKLEGLAKAGANLEFIISRRTSNPPGCGIVFVTPLSGEAQMRAAAEAGFHRTEKVASLRVEAPDHPGLGYLVARALGAAGIDVRGVSAAVLGGRVTMFLAFDSPADAERAVVRLNAPL